MGKHILSVLFARFRGGLGAIVLGACFFAPQVNASVVEDFGVLNVGDVRQHTEIHSGSGVTIDDDYTFTPGQDATAVAAAVSLVLPPFYDIDNLLLQLFEDGSAVAIASGLSFSAPVEENVDYVLKVTGETSSDTQGGSYLIGVGIVPVPPSVVLLISALVGFSLVARRRSADMQPGTH